MITAPVVTSLPVMEHFYTLQGEGVHQGKAAYFIRLGGCDVGCTWCDVKDSWEAGRHPLHTIDNLVLTVQQVPGEIVVITGGEPLMHDLTLLTEALHAAGKRTHMETSGSSPLSGSWDWITLSPKKFKQPLPGILPLASELKIVVYNKSDFDWAEKWAAVVAPSTVSCVNQCFFSTPGLANKVPDEQRRAGQQEPLRAGQACEHDLIAAHELDGEAERRVPGQVQLEQLARFFDPVSQRS